jgi:hypothetical protein
MAWVRARGPEAGSVVRDTPLVTQRLLALFAVALLLFNFPLLALWDQDTLLWGLPLLPMALFVLWAGLLVILALMMERLPD